MRYSKDGFTLVELSIVLVIIGLLIGGILVGQSMIESAKVGGFVRQISQYDIAVDVFQSRYKSVPGDTKLLTNPGDGNGWVEDSTAPGLPGTGYDNFDDEIANFWVHMQEVRMLKDNKTYISTGPTMTTVGNTVNLPSADYGTNAAFLAFGNSEIWQKLQYLVGDYEGASISNFSSSGAYPRPAFTPTQAMTIDAKMDDGIFNTGDVGAAGAGGLANCANCGTPATTCYLSGPNRYNVEEDSLQCLLRIKMRRESSVR